MATTNERLADNVLEHKAAIAGVENSIFRTVNRPLTEARREVLDMISEAVQGSLNKYQLDSLSARITARLNIAKEEITESLHDKLLTVSQAEAKTFVSVMKRAMPTVLSKEVVDLDMDEDMNEELISEPVRGYTYTRAVAIMIEKLAGKIEAIINQAYSDTFKEMLDQGNPLSSATGAATDASKKLSAQIGEIRKVF